MFGIILIILGAIGTIVQANAWFTIPNIITTGLFICGVTAIIIQIVVTIVIAKKARKSSKDFFDKF